MFDSIVEAVFRHAKQHPDRLCLADDGGRVTYREYAEKIARLAGAFAATGIAPGDRVVIEACQTIHALEPKAEVAYLEGDRAPGGLHRMGLTGIDYHISKFKAHPEWVSEAHQLGMNVNVWTVDSPDDIRDMKALGVDYITTNEPALCESIVK